MTAEQILAAIRAHDAVMQFLGSDCCAIEHVSRRNPDGPDERVDSCPCPRGLETLEGAEPAELGGGQYLSSARHTLADVVRDLA